MIGLTPVQIQPKVQMQRPANLAFRGEDKGKYDDAIDAGEKVLKGATTKPDVSAIKAAFAALGTLVGVFVTKNAKKIQAFVERGSKSPKPIVKAIAMAAGALLSILSILSGTTIFKDKVEEAQKKADSGEEAKVPPPVEKDDAAEEDKKTE